MNDSRIITFMRSRFSLKARLGLLCLFVIIVSIFATLSTPYEIYLSKVEGSVALSEQMIRGPYSESIEKSLRLDSFESTKELSTTILQTTSISKIKIWVDDEIAYELGSAPEDVSVLYHTVEDERFVYPDDLYSELEPQSTNIVVEIARVEYYVDNSFGQYLDELIKNIIIRLLILSVLMPLPIWLIYKSITKPIENTVNYANKYIAGHTRSIPPSKFNDEHSQVQNTLHKLVNVVEGQKSELQHREMIAVEKQEEADAANYAKDEFVKQLSHMTRTPSSSLSSTMTLLETYLANLNYTLVRAADGKSATGYEEFIKMSMTALPTMLKVVDDGKGSSTQLLETFEEVMDVVNVIYDGVSLRYLPVDIKSNLERIIKTYPTKHINHDVDFGYEFIISPSLEETIVVSCDWLRIHQVVNQLVANAYKFTKEGLIKVLVTLTDISDRIELKINVIDTGCGIPPDRYKAIFDIFAIGESVTTKKHSSLGAGLTKINKISDAMGGAIKLDSSEVGQGSSFTFTISLDKSNENPESMSLNTVPSNEMSILYVDDIENMRFLFKLYAEQRNLNITLADSAKAAFELFKVNIFDALVVDVHMPEESGIDLVKRIRAYENEKGLDPALIFSMTAENSVTNAEECLENGFNEFLTKPFRVMTFEEIESRIQNKDRIYG